jgi:hypothetical protein
LPETRENKTSIIILERKPHGKQLLGRPLVMFENTIKVDFRETVLRTGDA